MSAQTIVTTTVLPRRIPELQVAAPLFGRTVNAFAWRFVSESSRFGLQLAVMIVLARLLPVDSFGLLTLSMIVINFASRAQLGVSSALVQCEELTETHVRVAFSLSVLSGIILALLIWLGAPLAAAIFRAEAVTNVLRLVSLSFLLMSFGAIAEALLERKLDFRSLLKVELLSYGIGYCLVAITLALFDYGVWALAWATVVYSLLKTGLLFSVSPHSWRPSFAGSESIKFLKFGTGTSLARLASFAAANGDYFVVGRWLGTTALGLYSRAFQLMSLPMYQFSSVINYVLFPAYAKIQNETDRLKRAYLGSVSLSVLVVLPALTSLGIAAPDLIVGCFGPQWIDATLPLQILCIGGVFQCTYNLADSLARAKGAVYWKFWCHTVYALCVLLASFIGSRWGIIGVAVGVVAAMSVIYFLMAQLSIYLTGASWKEFFSSQLPGLIVAASVAAISFPLTVMLRATQLPHLAILAISLTVSLVAAVTTGSLLPRLWLDKVSHGSGEKVRDYYLEVSKIVDPLRSVKTYLRQNKTAFGIALVPYRLYENILYVFHINREGLWRGIIGLRRGVHHQTKNQSPMTWDVSVPCCDTPAELIKWFRDQDLEVKEGGHTFYIPPQKNLEKIVPSVVSFYPPGSGFKVLKDFRRPEQARYFYKHGRSLFFLRMLIGRPQDQVVTANYLYALGIGSRIWDLTCWRAQGVHYTVFVVEHVHGGYPSLEQYQNTMDHLKRLYSHSHLRILIRCWEQNEDFSPPNCHNNLLAPNTMGRALYVDFQNFGLTSVHAWRKDIELRSPRFPVGSVKSIRAAKRLHSVSRVAPGSVEQHSPERWAYVTKMFRDNGLSVSGRVVLHIGCNSGAIIRSSLADGAFWCFGWCEPVLSEYVRNLTFSSGATRFILATADLRSDYKLEDDIPVGIRRLLSEAVVFYSDGPDRCVPTSLCTLPWRVLVYDRHESDQLGHVPTRLESALSDNTQQIASSSVTDDKSRIRSISIFLRR